jgi:hypothetical protein
MVFAEELDGSAFGRQSVSVKLRQARASIHQKSALQIKEVRQPTNPLRPEIASCKSRLHPGGGAASKLVPKHIARATRETASKKGVRKARKQGLAKAELERRWLRSLFASLGSPGPARFVTRASLLPKETSISSIATGSPWPASMRAI